MAKVASGAPADRPGGELAETLEDPGEAAADWTEADATQYDVSAPPAGAERTDAEVTQYDVSDPPLAERTEVDVTEVGGVSAGAADADATQYDVGAAPGAERTDAEVTEVGAERSGAFARRADTTSSPEPVEDTTEIAVMAPGRPPEDATELDGTEYDALRPPRGEAERDGTDAAHSEPAGEASSPRSARPPVGVAQEPVNGVVGDAAGSGRMEATGVGRRRIESFFRPPDEWPADPFTRAKAHSGPVRCIACSSTVIVSGSGDDDVHLWRVRESSVELQRSLRDHEFGICGLDVSRDEQQLVASTMDGQLRLWDLRTETFQANFVAGPGAFSQVRFSLDGRKLISGGPDGCLHIWDIRQGKRVAHVQMGAGALLSVALSPGGGFAAYGSERGVVGLVNFSTEKPVGMMAMHRRPLRGVSFSNDSRRLVAGCDDGHVSVLNPKLLEKSNSHSVLQLFSAHSSWVTSLAYHPASADHVFTASRDNTVRLWTLGTAGLVREWNLHSPVWSVACAPTGAFWAVGLGNNSVSVFR